MNHLQCHEELTYYTTINQHRPSARTVSAGCQQVVDMMTSLVITTAPIHTSIYLALVDGPRITHGAVTAVINPSTPPQKRSGRQQHQSCRDEK